MLKLYREPVDPAADAIEAELKDLLLAYECVVLDRAAARQEFGPEHSLPILSDNAIVVSGQPNLQDFIQQLRQLMHDWQAFQGDSCYVDEDGNPC